MALGQAASVYGMGSGRVRRTPYVNQIRSAYGQATADVLARKKREQEEQALRFDQKVAKDQLGLLKAQNQLEREQAAMAAENQKRAMGMNIGTLGMNVAGRAAGNQNLRIGTGTQGLNLAGTRGINLGSLAGSGLAGYGAYQAMGGGAKGAAAGIGAGLLTDAVSGGGLSSALLEGVKKIPGAGNIVSGAAEGIGNFMDWIF